MKTSIKQGAFYLTVSSFIFIIIGYLLNIWLGRFLGPVQYGNYGVIISIVSLVNLIQTTGFTQSASKYIAENEHFSDAIFKSSLYIQMIATVIITILFLILAYPLAYLLNDLSLVPYIQLAAFIFPIFGYYALLVDYYNGLRYFKKQAILNTVYSITKALGVVSFAYFFQLKGVIIGFIIAPILAILTGFYFPKPSKTHFPYKKLILFSLPLIGYIIFSTLLQSIDLYFVKSLLPGKASGYYTASQNISRLIFFATSAIATVLLPSISNSVSQNLHNKTKKTIAISLRTLLIFTVPAVLVISATSKQLLILIYSHAYTPASESLSILAIAFGFFTIFTLLSTVLNGAGNPKLPFIFTVCCVIINMLLCVILIPILNTTGAAFASTISIFIGMCLSAFFVYKHFQQLTPINSLIKILLSSITIYILARITNPPVFFLPFLYIFLFIIYLCLLILMREVTKKDIDSILSLLPAWVHKNQQNE